MQGMATGWALEALPEGHTQHWVRPPQAGKLGSHRLAGPRTTWGICCKVQGWGVNPAKAAPEGLAPQARQCHLPSPSVGWSVLATFLRPGSFTSPTAAVSM